ncbi:hypothetical protein B0H14DRAFT_3160398 [Mycena olivaceomarginata]|nr:hypothetical protein B0H14DRAFT_3160398 [Mycena olivaceomarginata]
MDSNGLSYFGATESPLDSAGDKDYHGYWSEGPPDTIDRNWQVEVKIRDNIGLAGSEGFLRYKHFYGVKICSTFSCPTHGDNTVKIWVDVEGLKPMSVRVEPPEVPTSGHPVTDGFQFSWASIFCVWELADFVGT